MLEAELNAAVEALTRAGVVQPVVRIVRECWRDNLARHDVQKGDDTRTLALVTAMNISNRLLLDPTLDGVAEGVDGWAVLRLEGYELKTYKLPGYRATVSPQQADWTGSDTKERGARENTEAVQLALFGDAAKDETFVPPTPRRLHLVHTADDNTGEVVLYIGFPRLDDDGQGPWFAVQRLDPPDDGTPQTVEPVVPTGDGGYEEQPVPDVPVRLRRPASAPAEG